MEIIDIDKFDDNYYIFIKDYGNYVERELVFILKLPKESSIQVINNQLEDGPFHSNAAFVFKYNSINSKGGYTHLIEGIYDPEFNDQHVRREFSKDNIFIIGDFIEIMH